MILCSWVVLSAIWMVRSEFEYSAPKHRECYGAKHHAIAQHVFAVPIDELVINEPDDDFDGDLIGHPIPFEVSNGPAFARALAKIFLNGVPWYEWNLQEEGANNLIVGYTAYLMQLPEYSLT